MSSYIPFVVLWVVLAAAVIGLIIYRRIIAASEDDMIHVADAGEASITAHQVAVGQKLDQIDKWGKILTAVVVVYGVVLAALYVYQTWVSRG
ncbi:MAG: hypothetical protein ABSH42_12580 [Bryobacteraceae bacterium]|jgi:hypothetical protein